MRYAIWAAVSSESQAGPDKVSLQAQQDQCRFHGNGRGWVEAAGPFVVPGESRTRWVNLRDAEESLPALKDMLNAAQRREYDLLLLYDYTRLRDLLDPVAKTLTAYGVQLYAITQPVEPLAPETFESNETASALQFVASFTSRTEIANLRRRYRLGMPRRVINKGLHVNRIPYGYRKPPGHDFDRNAIPIQDPVQVAIILEMKDLLLAGNSFRQIAAELTRRRRVMPNGGKHWGSTAVRNILTRRYYCGEVQFGISRRTVDPRTGKVRMIKNPASRVLVGKGKHKPLWTMKTQRRIDAELARRGRSFTGITTHRLSNLLYCGICGERLYVTYNGGRRQNNLRYICKQTREHINELEVDLVPRVAAELITELGKEKKLPALETDQSTVDTTQAAIDNLHKRKTRLLEAYETGALELPIYTDRMETINKQLHDLEKKRDNTQTAAARRQEQHDQLISLAATLQEAPDYLTDAPAQDVNTQLCHILERITVTSDDIRFTFLL